MPGCQIGMRCRSIRSVAAFNLGAIIVATLGKVMAWCRGMGKGRKGTNRGKDFVAEVTGLDH